MNTNSANITNIGTYTNELFNITYNYMNQKKEDSSNSYKSYMKNLNIFFQYMCKKDLVDITWEDVLAIDRLKVTNFRNMLNAKKFKHKTVDQYMGTISSYWKELCRYNNDLILYTTQFPKMYNPKKEDTSYASFHTEEINLLFDFCKTQNYKPDVLYLFFKFLYILGCRKDIPMNITWGNIKKETDLETKMEVWVVKFIDKGKLRKEAISDEFYNELLTLKKYNSDKIFPVGSQKIELVFKEFQKKYNLFFRYDKKLVIHSIRKASGQSIYQMDNDIQAAKEHLGHSNVNTTSSIYVNATNNYTKHGSYKLSSTVNITIKDLEWVDKEILLKAIEQCGTGTIMSVYNQVDKLIK